MHETLESELYLLSPLDPWRRAPVLQTLSGRGANTGPLPGFVIRSLLRRFRGSGREDDRILGFTVFGVDGGEIMSAVQIAMIAGLPYTALGDAILTHPTLAGGLIALFSSAPIVLESR